MKSSKALAALLSFSLFTATPGVALAADLDTIQPIIAPIRGEEVLPVIKPQFTSFSGKVTQIADYSYEGAKMISLVNEGGQPANIIVDQDTYILDNASITEGDFLTVFYDQSLPMIMIYPPQYKAEVIVVGEVHENIKVDVFNEDLVSSDNALKLNLAHTTKIISVDGNLFEGKLAHKKLVVLYGATTKSIPAQTIPTKIVVLLDEKDSSSVNQGSGAREEVPVHDGPLAVIVKGKQLEATGYVDDAGTVMVPLRPVAQVLGLEVRWDKIEEKVFLENDMFLQIGGAYYTRSMEQMALETAPVLRQGTTFVPLSFIQEALGVKANLSGAEIIIEK